MLLQQLLQRAQQHLYLVQTEWSHVHLDFVHILPTPQQLRSCVSFQLERSLPQVVLWIIQGKQGHYWSDLDSLIFLLRWYWHLIFLLLLEGFLVLDLTVQRWLDQNSLFLFLQQRWDLACSLQQIHPLNGEHQRDYLLSPQDLFQPIVPYMYSNQFFKHG